MGKNGSDSAALANWLTWLWKSGFWSMSNWKKADHLSPHRTKTEKMEKETRASLTGTLTMPPGGIPPPMPPKPPGNPPGNPPAPAYPGKKLQPWIKILSEWKKNHRIKNKKRTWSGPVPAAASSTNFKLFLYSWFSPSRATAFSSASLASFNIPNLCNANLHFGEKKEGRELN